MFLADHFRSKNKFEETKFVFPNAPNIPITINMGMRCYHHPPTPSHTN